MKGFGFKQGCVALLCMAAAMGFAGCDDSDDDDSGPSSIAGTWTVTFWNADWGTVGPDTYSFVQNGSTISGSYTFDGDRVFSLSGTYSDGTFSGTDSAGWAHHLEFEENSADGTIAGIGGDGLHQVWTATLTRN